MLTPRQAEICTRVAGGMTAKAIARDLGLSVKTVEAHIHAASSRIPCGGPPRHRCHVWFFNLRTDQDDAA